MRIPEFTAEVSLGKSRGRYRVQISGASATRDSIQPQQGRCFCSEPDTRTVCTSPGHCYEKKVCLQWFCPGRGQEVDEDYFGDLGVTVYSP